MSNIVYMAAQNPNIKHHTISYRDTRLSLRYLIDQMAKTDRIMQDDESAVHNLHKLMDDYKSSCPE